MSKWKIDQAYIYPPETNIGLTDFWLASGLLEERKIVQEFTNLNTRKLINQLELNISRNLRSEKLISRKINFSTENIVIQEKLKELFQKKSIPFVSVNDNKFNFSVVCNKTEITTTLLQTLDAISPFSKEMKISLMDLLAPKNTYEKNCNLQILFSSFQASLILHLIN